MSDRLLFAHEWAYVQQFVSDFENPGPTNISIDYFCESRTAYNLYQNHVQCHKKADWKICGFEKYSGKTSQWRRYIYHDRSIL